MGIEITAGDTVEALVYNKIHLENLLVEQPLIATEQTQPIYRLTIRYRIYAVGSTGQRYYIPGARFIRIEDYLTLAITKAGEGDEALLGALLAIETALATIISDQGALGAAQVI